MVPLLSRWVDDPWHGNVRELRNAVLRNVARSDTFGTIANDTVAALAGDAGEAARPADLIDTILSARLPLAEARARLVEEFELCYVERALHEHGGVVTRAAEASGIARRHFQRLKARNK